MSYAAALAAKALQLFVHFNGARHATEMSRWRPYLVAAGNKPYRKQAESWSGKWCDFPGPSFAHVASFAGCRRLLRAMGVMVHSIIRKRCNT